MKDHAGLRKVFDLVSPTQLLSKLEWETQQVKDMLGAEDPKAIFAAFNAAATAWHITDWVRTLSRVYPSEKKLPIDEKTYRADAISRCPNHSADYQVLLPKNPNCGCCATSITGAVRRLTTLRFRMGFFSSLFGSDNCSFF